MVGRTNANSNLGKEIVIPSMVGYFNTHSFTSTQILLDAEKYSTITIDSIVLTSASSGSAFQIKDDGSTVIYKVESNTSNVTVDISSYDKIMLRIDGMGNSGSITANNIRFLP